MQHFLRKAFYYASTAINKISDMKDRAGFLAYRVMMDETLFRIDPASIKSRHLQGAALMYGLGHKAAREKLYNIISQKTAGGDFSPKPSIKSGLLRTLEVAAVVIPKLNLTSPAMMASVTLIAITGALLSAQHGGADIAAVWMSSKPQGRSMQP